MRQAERGKALDALVVLIRKTLKAIRDEIRVKVNRRKKSGPWKGLDIFSATALQDQSDLPWKPDPACPTATLREEDEKD